MRKKIIVFAVLSAVYIIFFPMLREWIVNERYGFEFIVSGEKNEESLGTEIWLDAVLADGEMCDLSRFALGDGWEQQGRIFNPGMEPGRHTVVFPYGERVEFVFIKHPYSGVIQVKHKGETRKIDLFSEKEETVSMIFE